MHITHVVIMSLGWLCACSISLGLLFIAFMLLADALRKLHERVHRSAAELALRDAGNQMLSGSWWFNEHPEARHAVRAFGEALQFGHVLDPATVRTRFRSLMAEDLRESTAGLKCKADPVVQAGAITEELPAITDPMPKPAAPAPY